MAAFADWFSKRAFGRRREQRKGNIACVPVKPILAFYGWKMSNDIVPSQPGSLSGFIDKLNLPSMIAGPAGTAIARLVGAAVDVPVAYLEIFARAIRARAEAKDAVNKEIATAAAHFAAGDSDLVARAAYLLVAKDTDVRRTRRRLRQER